MPNIDNHITSLLNDAKTDNFPESETGYYAEAFASLRGPDSAMMKLSWTGILVFSGLLIVCIIKFFGADNTRDQIFFAAAAILLNSSQIAVKLWFNMRLNRLAIMRELKAVRLALAEEQA
ncbi:DUF6768 family protein [Robiginitomaculum antarcticum]|uniref:DUF6768 family protein n=1 Tax=Robiginitomaculum antarcticum TaxID=437507 RepID=UPI00037911CC|nr:DUF6768 family protein [Robiginitomaculum antarcticum]